MSMSCATFIPVPRLLEDALHACAAYWYSEDVIFRLSARVASATMTKTMNKIALMVVVARAFPVIIALMATRTPILMRLTHQ